LKHICIIAACVLLVGCGERQLTPADILGASPAPAVLTNLPPQVMAFVERKERLALTLAAKLGVTPDQSTQEYFRLAKKGQYRAASRIYQDLRERGGKVDSPKHDPKLRLPLWDPLLDAYAAGAGTFAATFGETAARSIPHGSIYFGGTDPGRGLPAAFLAHTNDAPDFIIVSQNQLADAQHLSYLRAAFGDAIRSLSNEDSQRGFQEYLDDAKRRFLHDRQHSGEPPQLRPGENVTVDGDRPQVSGQVAVMQINGLLARRLFVLNPEREFYVEEGFPLDWMYPHLTSHGFIMKLNRQAMDELPAEVVAQDRVFWDRQQVELIGRWLTPTTSVADICRYAEKVFLRKDLTGLSGDREFVGNVYAAAMFGKLRLAQAGVYAWRAGHAKSSDEQQRMIASADFAFRQALAFHPAAPETAYRYSQFLINTGRMDEALLITRTAKVISARDSGFEKLEQELIKIRDGLANGRTANTAAP
jgi:hypothetical protein